MDKVDRVVKIMEVEAGPRLFGADDVSRVFDSITEEEALEILSEASRRGLVWEGWARWVDDPEGKVYRYFSFRPVQLEAAR